ncbi:MAG: MarR family transcriptional regulator [bacterium]
MTPADRICFALYSATHAMQRVYQPLLAPLGLTYPQFLVLVALWEADGQTVGALGRTLMLESNTLTPLLKRMEAQGLVTRTRVAEDERQVRVALTDAGQAMQAQADGISRCIFEACGVEMDELVALRDQIIGLRDRLLTAG